MGLMKTPVLFHLLLNESVMKLEEVTPPKQLCEHYLLLCICFVDKHAVVFFEAEFGDKVTTAGAEIPYY